MKKPQALLKKKKNSRDIWPKTRDNFSMFYPSFKQN